MPAENRNTAAAILVQTMFAHNQGLQHLMQKSEVSASPENAADFIKPYFEAMLKVVKNP
jgi:hypothetical protein